MIVKATRLSEYSLQLSSNRVTPSHSLSEVQWIDEIPRKRETSGRRHRSKKTKFTVAAIATGISIAILVSLAILLPTINFSETTTISTVMSNISATFLSTAASTAASVLVTSTSTSITLTSLSTTITVTTTTSTTTTTTTSTSTTSTTTTSTSTTTTTSTSTTSTTTTSTSTTTTTSTSTTTTTTTSTSTTTTTTSTETTTTTTSTVTTTTITYGSLRWNTTGITIAGSITSTVSTPQYLNFPLSITIDSSDTLYIADARNNRIQRFVPGNTTGTTVAGQSNGIGGPGPSLLNYPNDVAVDSYGNLYVVDTNNHRIQLWYANASSGITIAGNGTAGNSTTQLDSPRSIALDPYSDTFYVSDCYNNRIMSYTLNSTVGTVIAGGNGTVLNITQMNDPRGLYYDFKTNSLIIANRGENNIIRLEISTSNWTVIAGSSLGTVGSGSKLLDSPWDLTFDPAGNLYVADRYNQRIQFFQPNENNGTTIAGVSGTAGNTATRFTEPISVALDSQLNLYVVDSQNNRIQKFVRY